jgi:hypothetical protein
MNAIADYASSLEAITNAGKEGKESAKALGNSVEGLLGALGIVPGTQIAGVTKETVEFIYGEVSKVRAQNSLEKSLKKTGPIMENIVAILEKDSNLVKSSFEIAINAQISQLRRNNAPVRTGGERDDLIKLRTYRNKAIVDELKRPHPKNHAKQLKELTQDISIIDMRLSILTPEWVSYSKDLKDIQKRKRLGLGLIHASSRALTTWKSSHVKLSDAVKKNESPSIHELIAAANDVQALIKKWGDL